MNEKEDKKLSHGRDSKATQKCMDMKLQEELYIYIRVYESCLNRWGIILLWVLGNIFEDHLYNGFIHFAFLL